MMTVAPFIDELEAGVGDLYDLDNYYMKNAYPVRSIAGVRGPGHQR